MRDDSMEVFLYELQNNKMHEFTYKARAVTQGNFYVPGSRIEEMYCPSMFATSNDIHIKIQ